MADSDEKKSGNFSAPTPAPNNNATRTMSKKVAPAEPEVNALAAAKQQAKRELESMVIKSIEELRAAEKAGQSANATFPAPSGGIRPGDLARKFQGLLFDLEDGVLNNRKQPNQMDREVIKRNGFPDLPNEFAIHLAGVKTDDPKTAKAIESLSNKYAKGVSFTVTEAVAHDLEAAIGIMTQQALPMRLKGAKGHKP